VDFNLNEICTLPAATRIAAPHSAFVARRGVAEVGSFGRDSDAVAAANEEEN